ncbi:MAG: response regulator [Anaerolineales bacterium]
MPEGTAPAQRVLIVDDDLDTLKLVGTTLEKQGFTITAANSGEEALQKVSQEKPDLILLDIMMPRMDGYEVTRRLRANPSTASIPIILFTAKSQVEDKVTGLEVGADDYLTKPTHPAELVARVRSMLKRPISGAPTPAPIEEPALQASVVGIIGSKGGQGTSTLAINLAAAYQVENRDATVVLAELRPGRGDVSNILGYGDAPGLMTLLNKPVREINAKHVEASLVKQKSGLRLLLASNRPTDVDYINYAEQIEVTVSKLAELADYLVLDLGVGLPPSTLKTLAQCSKVIVIVEPDPLTMPLTRALLDDLNANGVPPKKIVGVLINRVRTEAAMNPKMVQEAIGLEIRAVFTPAPELAFQAARAHRAMVELDPNSFTAQQTKKLISHLSETEED